MTSSLFHRLSVSALILLSVSAARAAVGPQTIPVELRGYGRAVYVDQVHGSDPDGDGSAAHPWATITCALENVGRVNARARVAVLIAAGRYAEPTLVLKPHVDLYGGFARAGGARDIVANRTFLDGCERQRVMYGADDARVDGVAFVNGRVRGKGAALLCDGTSPAITNCVFTENRTLIPEPWRPTHLHETANDGGAVMVTNGGAPHLDHDLFYHNTTECGRGAAVAVDRASAPQITQSVFVNNRAGLDDPFRSSDGGGIAVFDHSPAVIADNVVAGNEALTSNDAGGIWIALWSSARVERNRIVANRSGDDAGGLFVGGQEHRYGVALDPYPPANKFKVIIADNVFVGNANGSRNSGASRITMESRVQLTGNVIADNAGGLYLQRSEVNADHNIVWQDWKFIEDKPTLGPSRLTNNILLGPAPAVEARATFDHNLLPPALATGTNAPVSDVFETDGIEGSVSDERFDENTFTTTFKLGAPLPAASLAGRVVRIGESRKGGQWAVIKAAAGNELTVWGALEPTTKPAKSFAVMRTFTPKPGAFASLPPSNGATR